MDKYMMSVKSRWKLVLILNIGYSFKEGKL